MRRHSGHRRNGAANGSSLTPTDGTEHLPCTSAQDGRAGGAKRLKPILITGGAGFIGTNVAAELLQNCERVLILDNLSRAGVVKNLEWLLAEYGSSVRIEVADIRDERAVRHAVSCAQSVFHFCAQVAVTTSLADPCSDFEVNARGSLNVLEAARHLPSPPTILYTSTNKVYGELAQLELVEEDTRYAPTDQATRLNGAGEDRPLNFHSPYGCSKGTADQYMLDYARCYRLPVVVFRMSCIYGPHQCGNEDQGWVAHFLLQALRDEAITIYGDGKQVRDVLYVEDLVRAMLLAVEKIEVTRGRAFNIGGGPRNACSLLELIDLIEQLHGRRVRTEFAPWRPADQRYYVSDTRAFQAATGWKPQVGVSEGVERLYDWLRQEQFATKQVAAV